VECVLYEQGKNALALRTLVFFDDEHPNSAFREEMTFLRANALIKLGMTEEATVVENAVRMVLKAGFRTEDIRQEGAAIIGTVAMGDLLAEKVGALMA